MKPTLKFIVPALLLMSSAMLSSCNPETILAKNLEGDWEVTSYTADGEEFINFFITRFDMEFEEYDGDEGDFNFTVLYDTGETESLSGEYSLNADGDEIDLNYTDGTIEMWDIDLEGDDLEMDLNLNGVLLILKADRD